MATFGERIKELRQQKGLTQRQMADSFGITERNYQRYEATDSPSNDTLLKLANFFEATTDYLLGRTDKNYRINTYGNIVDDTSGGVLSVFEPGIDTLKRKYDDSDNTGQQLQILFGEPLQSYAVWLRNIGIPFLDGSSSEMLIAEIDEDVFYDISGSLDAIMQMSKDHFKLLVRQLGKIWQEGD
jgi:transcriptional regulator with XRE-family HTH domain